MKPKKSLGQNFLRSDEILSKIVNVGNINYNDTILEIGPGTGNLTKKILDKKPNLLIVVEKDEILSEKLKERFGNKITVINKDILNCYQEFKFEIPIKVFGNLPYNVSTKILTNFVKIKNISKIYQKFIFIYQKEVADRIIAKENSKYYGRLSILTSWRMDNEKILDIDPKYFYPKPKVWSSLIVHTPKTKVDTLHKPDHLEHITKIFFNQRRKMIKKPMRQLFMDYEKVAEKLKIDLSKRPQNISKSKYFEICKFYENLNQ